MSDVQTVYILDFSGGKVRYFNVPRNLDSEKIEDILEESGFRLKDIEWMVCDSHIPEEVVM